MLNKLELVSLHPKEGCAKRKSALLTRLSAVSANCPKLLSKTLLKKFAEMALDNLYAVQDSHVFWTMDTKQAWNLGHLEQKLNQIDDRSCSNCIFFLLCGNIFPLSKTFAAREHLPVQQKTAFQSRQISSSKMLDLLELVSLRYVRASNSSTLTHPPFKMWADQQVFSSHIFCCAGISSRAAKNWISKLGN